MMTGNPIRLLTYIPAQLLGAFLGAITVWLCYKPHWILTPDGDAKLACFSTSPAVRKPLWNFFSEVVGTFVLVLVATALFSKRVSPGGLAPGLGPVLVGALVWSIRLSLGERQPDYAHQPSSAISGPASLMASCLSPQRAAPTEEYAQEFPSPRASSWVQQPQPVAILICGMICRATSQ